MLPPGRQLPPSGDYADGADDYGSSGSGSGPSSVFKLRKFLAALRRFWWVPTLTLIIGIGAGSAMVYYMAPTYVSTAQMWEAMKIRLPEGGVFAEDVQTFLGTQTELLKSPTLQSLAIGRIRATGTNVNIPLDKDGNPSPVAVQLRQATKSAVYLLTATGTDPSYTRIFLDALMQAYLDYRRDIRKSISSDTLASISEQVRRAERDLTEARDNFLSYQRSNNLAIVQQEGTVAGAYLAQLQTRLADLELEAQLLDVATLGTNAPPMAGATSTNTPPAWSQAPSPITGSGGSGSMPPEVQVALRELAGLRAESERLSRFLRPKHPKMVKLAAEIARVDGLLGIYRTQNEAQLLGARRALQLRIDNVQASIREWQGKVIEANSRLADADQLRLRIQHAENTYDRLNIIVQNVGISRNIDQDTLAVLENANPSKRSFRSEITALGLSSVIGLAVGLGLIALVAIRDDRFDTHDDLDQAMGGSVVVGQVPEIEVASKTDDMPLITQADSRHMFAESYRSLRSALLYLWTDQRRPAVLLITSAAPGEGKSTVAVNLARTLAFGGSRVLLIDADLRRGRLHEVVGGRREPGLADILRQPERLEAAIQTDSLPNFGFIAGGAEATNPGDLLLSPHFIQILSKLRQRFDYILIDSSPVFAADDASTIAAQVDGTLFVVRRGYSRSALVQEALQVLLQRQAKILGLVFNRADTSLRSYRYYKYQEYYGRRRDGTTGTPLG